MRSRLVCLIAIGLITTCVAAANAAVVTLTFEGLQDEEPINNFYNGGLGGLGSGPGPNYGVTFSNNALAIIDSDAGGSGNFGGEPSPSTVMFYLTGSASIMNVAGGFNTGFSFYYTAINNPGVVDVYDGPNGTGTVLASLNLPVTPFNGAPDPTGAFSPLVPIGVPFAGTAMSVAFGGVQNQIAFDNVTFGSDVPTPEPSSLVLAALGLIGLGAYGWRRKR